MNRDRLAALHGVDVTYRPAPGTEHRVPTDTLIAVLASLGVDASTPTAVRAALAAARERRATRLLPPCTVVRPGRRTLRQALPHLPAGTRLTVLGPDGTALPGPPRTPGRRTLRAETPDGRTATGELVVAPARLPGPPVRTWGFMAQLYSVLSARSWGMGDLGDLAELAAWSGRGLGAGFVQINPLHAAVPGVPTDPSPYRPSSRRFPDPVYLRVADVPEYAYLPRADRQEADRLLARAAALRDSVLLKGALIDRDAVWELKARALDLLRRVPLSPGRRAAYADFLAAQGQALDDHATWQALAELHGPDWHAWPAGLRDPRSRQVSHARARHLERVDHHCWLAWLTDSQLAAAQRAARDAGMPVGVVHDLAVGVHPAGSDAWSMQDVLAQDMSIGAPPDAFNAHGQDWGLPPWRPDALAAAGYAPYRDLLARMLRHAGGLRIDHVMGLFRLWWVPRGRPPTQGAYVRYDAESMLGLLALEAYEAGAVVIGEDLGTVGPGVREELAGRGVLGTSVLWFERDYEGSRAAPVSRAPGGDGPADGRTDERRAADGRSGGRSGDNRPGAGDRPSAGGGTDQDGRTDTGGDAGAGEDGPAGPIPGEDDIERAGVEPDPRPLPPQAWREWCLATATTHDLPSTAARLTGEHVGLRHRLGLLAGPLAEEQAADSAEVSEWLALLERLGLLPEGAADEEAVVKAVHRFLARTPARMIGVWLPDAVGDRRPQNLPGTSTEYPNWRLPVAGPDGTPVSLEQLAASPRLHALVAEVRRDPAAPADVARAATPASGQATAPASGQAAAKAPGNAPARGAGGDARPG